MRRKRRIVRFAGRNSVFNKYLISYTSLALIGCLVAGMLLLFISTREIRSVARHSEKERLQIAADYLDAFEETMTDIAARIKLDKSYSSSFIERSVLHERDLIRSLSRFRDYSPLIDGYYLYYPERDVVYTDSTKCSSFEIFCRYLLKIDASEQLKQEWTGQGLNRWSESGLLPGNFICVKPLLSRNDTALLIFINDCGEMERRLSENIGLPSENELKLQLASGEMQADDDGLRLMTEKKNFCLSMEGDVYYERISRYLTSGVGWLLSIMAVLLMIAVYTAYQSYLPISRLMYTYVPDELAGNNSELEVIEKTLLTVLRDKSQSQRQVQKMLGQVRDQQIVLRHYLADEILNGRVDSTPHYSLQLAGIDFSRKYFMLVLVACQEKMDIEKINATMEGISDENMNLFCVRIPEEERIAVLVNLREADNALYVMEIMESIFEKASMRCSEVISDLTQLNAVWLELNDRKMEETLEESLERVTAYIRSGDSESALSYLRKLLGARHEQSELEQRGVYLEIIRYLCSLANENHVMLGAECTKNMLLVNTEQQLFSIITPVIYEIASVTCQDIDDSDARRLIDCIDQNLSNYELSREWVAENCHMSEHMVGKIFRNIIKMTYTDYVRIRRLNKAKELLVNTDMTVNAIGNSLGYINISYFIRAFKEYVGTTPAMYRAEGKKKMD